MVKVCTTFDCECCPNSLKLFIYYHMLTSPFPLNEVAPISNSDSLSGFICKHKVNKKRKTSLHISQSFNFSYVWKEMNSCWENTSSADTEYEHKLIWRYSFGVQLRYLWKIKGFDLIAIGLIIRHIKDHKKNFSFSRKCKLPFLVNYQLTIKTELSLVLRIKYISYKQQPNKKLYKQKETKISTNNPPTHKTHTQKKTVQVTVHPSRLKLLIWLTLY